MTQQATEQDSVTRERIRSRVLADEIFELVESECAASLESPEFVTRFWTLLSDKIAEKIRPVDSPAPPAAQPAKMTDAESRVFEQRQCTFGKHSGSQFSAVPLEYLAWLADQPDIKDDIRRYLASDRIAAEMANIDTDDE